MSRACCPRFALPAFLFWLFSLSAVFAQVPGAPQNPKAVQGNAQVAVSWTAPTGTVTGYNVYRSIVSGSETKITPSPISSTSLIDTGLTNGQIYYYEVTALNGSGEGPFSAEKSTTPNVYVDAATLPPLLQTAAVTHMLPITARLPTALSWGR